MKIDDVRKYVTENGDRTKTDTVELSFFQDADAKIEGMTDTQAESLRDWLDTYLETNGRSILGQYVSGIVFLRRHPQEDNLALLGLAESFESLKKWDIVDFLTDKILAVTENRFALRIKAHACEARGDEKGKLELYEKLIRVDHSETAIVRELARRALKSGDTEKAVTYDKVAFERLLSREEPDLGQIKDLFIELYGLKPDDFDYFLGLTEKVAATSSATAVTLLREMESHVKDDIDRRIICEKRILLLDTADNANRQALVNSYREKYKNSSRLQICLTEAGLNRPGRKDIAQCIENFEKNILFDKGVYVWQPSRSALGRILAMDDNSVTIGFVGEKKPRKMSPDMCMKALEVLPRTNIRVKKAFVDPQKLAEKTEQDPKWMLNCLLSSHGGRCSLKEMKKDLVPSVLSESQWNAFNKKAHEILMNDPYYDVTPDSDDYILRTTPVTYEEKILTLFAGAATFYDKVGVVKKFLSGKGDTDSEAFYRIISYFGNILENHKDDPVIGDETLGSYLLLDNLLSQQHLTQVVIPQGIDFARLTGKLGIPEMEDLFSRIGDPDLKRCFIDWSVETRKDWPDLLLVLFPYYLTGYIPEIYRKKEKSEVFDRIYPMAVNDYRNYPNTLVYLLKNTSEKEWERVGITQDRLLLSEVSLLSYLNQKVEGRNNGQEAGSLAKMLREILFGKKALRSVNRKNDVPTEGDVFRALHKDEATARATASLVRGCYGLPDGDKMIIEADTNLIYEKQA